MTTSWNIRGFIFFLDDLHSVSNNTSYDSPYRKQQNSEFKSFEQMP